MLFNLTVGMSAWAPAWFVTGWAYENLFCDSLYGFALPGCNPKLIQKMPLQDEHHAGLASYGYGCLQHNAHNCLNMALRTGSSCCKWLWCLGPPSSMAGPGDHIRGVTMRKPMPCQRPLENQKAKSICCLVQSLVHNCGWVHVFNSNCYNYCHYGD